MRVNFALFFAATLVISGTFAVDAAHAGGCQRQRQPGDYLNCGPNGPYGPSGPNYVQCRAECSALKNCLNNPPAGGCGAQTTALEACAPGVHVPGVRLTTPGATGIPTVAYKKGMGCFLTNSGSSAVATFVLEEGTTRGRAAEDLSTQKCLEASADMIMRGGGDTGFIGDVVARRLRVDRSVVTESADLYADLGASYDDVRGIAQELGNAFSVKVSEEAIKHMDTVGDIVDCTESAMMQ